MISGRSFACMESSAKFKPRNVCFGTRPSLFCCHCPEAVIVDILIKHSFVFQVLVNLIHLNTALMDRRVKTSDICGVKNSGEINARGGRNGKKNHIDTGVKTYIQHSQRLCSVYLYTRALEKQLSDAKTRACVATDPSPGQSLDVQVKICSYNVLCACDRIDCSDKV